MVAPSAMMDGQVKPTNALDTHASPKPNNKGYSANLPQASMVHSVKPPAPPQIRQPQRPPMNNTTPEACAK
jgi:hypothetical protein